ncbi:MAG: hypothetical protein V3U79_01230 [Dehalococcoidia bacterium]
MRIRWRASTPGVYVVVSRNGVRVGRPKEIEPRASGQPEGINSDRRGQRAETRVLVVTEESRLELENTLVDGLNAIPESSLL